VFDCFVERWASLDAHGFFSGVVVLVVFHQEVHLVAHQAGVFVLALETTRTTLGAATGGGSSETLLALHANTSSVTSVAIGGSTVLASLASGSVILDTLSIFGVDLDLTRLTSGTCDALAGSFAELEALSTTLALGLFWSRASLTGRVALGALLGGEFLDVSFVIFDLNITLIVDLIHTKTAGGAFALVLTALLTVGLALEARVLLLVVEVRLSKVR
jgi:hypothetical protein